MREVGRARGNFQMPKRVRRTADRRVQVSQQDIEHVVVWIAPECLLRDILALYPVVKYRHGFDSGSKGVAIAWVDRKRAIRRGQSARTRIRPAVGGSRVRFLEIGQC